MSGSFFAILTAIAFSLNSVFIRKAVINISDTSFGMLITIPMALPFYFLILIFNGQLQSITSFSWQSYVWLSLAGILHFVVGRSLFYKCTQLAGANIASLLRRVNILVAVIIAITMLHEPLSWRLAAGVLLIIIGITLAGLNTQVFRDTGNQLSKLSIRALLLGLGNGIVWGLSPICIKLGLKDSGSPLAGVLISFLAATVFLIFSLLYQKKRIPIAHIKTKAAGFFFIAGLFTCIGNLIRYLAFSLAPASVVAPIISTSPVFLLIFSFIFNRKVEMFSKPVIIGTVSVVIGGILLV